MKSHRHIASWLWNTVLLAGLMLGMAMLLFGIAMRISQADWTGFALPIGAVIGLMVGLLYREHIWQRLLGFTGLLWTLAVIGDLSTPIAIPDSIPPGMNHLPYGLAEMMRPYFLFVIGITGGVCFIAAGIANLILYRVANRGITRP